MPGEVQAGRDLPEPAPGSPPPSQSASVASYSSSPFILARPTSEIAKSLKSILNLAVVRWSNTRGEKIFPLHMPHRKLVRILNYVWLLLVFPIAVAFLVGVLAHSASLGIKTFLLIECGMAVLSPLLNAVIGG